MILLLLSFVRTIVPAIVGAVMSYLVSLGLQVDGQFEAALSAVLFAVFTGLYYLIVRIIEMKFPGVGILLGYAKSPDSYSKGPGVDIPSKSDVASSIEITVNQPAISGTTLPGLNSSVVSLERVDGPDHRA